MSCHELHERDRSKRAVQTAGKDGSGKKQRACETENFQDDDRWRAECRKVVADKQDDRTQKCADRRQTGGDERQTVAEAQNGMQLLDTPGILWPKFEDPKAGMDLAFCGSIKDEILDLPTLGMELIGVLAENYPQLLQERYKLDEIAETPLENMENMSVKRGCILPGKRIDYERIARLVLDEFRGGKIGRITLERPQR